MNKNCIFTICAYNYFPYAKALLSSIRRLYGHAIDLYCVFTESEKPDVILPMDKCDAITLWADRLDIPNFHTLSFQFGIAELCTTIKPFLFTYLLKQGYEKIIYLDPDIMVYQPLDDVFDQLTDVDIIVTPRHKSLKATWDQEAHVHQVGVYNLGFAAFRNSEKSLEILEWWADRCSQIGYKHHDNYVVFFDQKFMDLLSVYANGHMTVSLHDGLNVAHWNLWERKLTQREGQYWSNECLLLFFHFSGWGRCRLNHRADVASFVKMMCRHQSDCSELIEKLCLEYVEVVLSMADYADFKNLPYQYATFDNGVSIQEKHRMMFPVYQKICKGMDTNPFSTSDNSFYEKILIPQKLLMNGLM